VTLALVPFAIDQPTSLALAHHALRTRLAPGESLADLWPPIDSSIRASRATGGLVRSEGEPRGIVVWEPAGPLGVAVRLLYLTPPGADAEGYRTVLGLTEHAAGPIAFAPGPLAGLSAEEESTLMAELGFAPYGRMEMGLPATASLAPRPPGSEGEVRAVRPEDEVELARLHERAYRNHLDRYLSIEDVDPTRDAERQIRDYFGGRWGPPLSPGSTVVELNGQLVAAALAVRRTSQVLIIDVMTDPSRQGTGLGRSALGGALVALRDRGESAIVLNVTEANERAIRLYSGLGFVRTLGPSQEWYNARRMHVEIPVAPSGHSSGTGADSAGR
jgi:ribosomal protein S18 acetylase RimI-like enzyme